MTDFLADLMSNFWLGLVIKLLIVALLIPVIGMIIGFAEMKLSAKMQNRVGPYYAGGRWGWAQLIADGVKFFQKEDVIPAEADRPVFKLAPAIVLAATVALIIIIPFGPNMAFRNLELGLFYALAISSISTIGVLVAGWASANKYSLIGSLRAAGQLIAYELPLVLSVVGVVILAGSMNLDAIVQAQIDLGIPYLVPQLIGFLIFFTAALAELSRLPFDMPIAESELVMGYLTEYTGFRFLFFFLAEFANMFTMSAIAATIFLGGYHLPGLSESQLQVFGPLILVGKAFLLVFVMLWFRWTFPRFREDQLQSLAWKVLVPLALANIAVTAILKVVI
ncbi:MAG TPA: NADH-quinone oxidoreductase subunit NuoH [Acidimicrobiia bacterium]|nr:NADH-quinone oxidoreductase subunit NuoH [Acidimicrobiia bacterium]